MKCVANVALHRLYCIMIGIPQVKNIFDRAKENDMNTQLNTNVQTLPHEY